MGKQVLIGNLPELRGDQMGRLIQVVNKGLSCKAISNK